MDSFQQQQQDFAQQQQHYAEKSLGVNSREPTNIYLTGPQKNTPVAPQKHAAIRKLLETESGEWKAVGSPRRASYAAPSSQTGNYFEENLVSISPYSSYSPASTFSPDEHGSRNLQHGQGLKRSPSTPPPPGFHDVLDTALMRRQSSASPYSSGPSFSENSNPDSSPEAPPIFQFYGGRNHGARSFSFNLGADPSAHTELFAPSPQSDEYLHHQQQGFSRPQALASLEEYEQHHQEPPSRWPHSTPSARDQLLHRRVSTFSNNVKPSWSHNSNIFNPSTSSPSRFQDTGRRVSTTALFSNGDSYLAPPPDSSEIATRYFNRDPTLLDRRHSMAALSHLRRQSASGSVISPSHSDKEDQLAQRLQQLELDGDNSDLPKDFAAQYGNIFEDSHVVDQHTARQEETSVSSKMYSEDSRGRSWSDPAKSPAGLASSRPRTPMATIHDEQQPHQKHTHPIFEKYGPLYIVEFKGGRNDIFFIPQESGVSAVRKNDLVLVEADRGKDLGKVVMAAIVDFAILQDFPGADDLLGSDLEQLKPKSILRHAQGTEVSMLMDKARDESKAMSICAAKVRSKQLPMEITDAEYQWDRKKLTFFFVSDQRIDFRELVKDLFKIYKTRIWMCAVERSKNGIRFVGTARD